RGVLPVSNPVNDTTMCSPSSLIWTYPCWCTSTPVAAGQYPCEYVLSPLRDDAAAIGAPSAVGNPPHGLFDPSSADRVCASPCTMKTLPTAFSNRSVRAATCAGYSVHPSPSGYPSGSSKSGHVPDSTMTLSGSGCASSSSSQDTCAGDSL